MSRYPDNWNEAAYQASLPSPPEDEKTDAEWAHERKQQVARDKAWKAWEAMRAAGNWRLK